MTIDSKDYVPRNGMRHIRGDAFPIVGLDRRALVGRGLQTVDRVPNLSSAQVPPAPAGGFDINRCLELSCRNFGLNVGMTLQCFMGRSPPVPDQS